MFLVTLLFLISASVSRPQLNCHNLKREEKETNQDILSNLRSEKDGSPRAVHPIPVQAPETSASVILGQAAAD
jgi:hypothetical protein